MSVHRERQAGLDHLQDILQGLKARAATQAFRLMVAYSQHQNTFEAEDDVPSGEPGSRLRPESALDEALLGWPERPFDSRNSILSRFGEEPVKLLSAGDPAVDFSLLSASVDAERIVRLRELLATRPVVLTAAMSTCPHFRGSVAPMRKLASDPMLSDAFHFVAVNTMQPHPSGEDRSYETGEVWTMPFSDIRQPVRFGARRADGQYVQELLGPAWTVLIDDLPHTQRSGEDGAGVDYTTRRVNPWWSTYGPAPRATYVIHPTGLLVFSQLWYGQARLHAALLRWLDEARSTSRVG